MANRLLPEWAPQDAVQLTWPGPDSDWRPLLERIEATLERLVTAIARYQAVLIAVPNAMVRDRLAERFAWLGVPDDRLHLIVAEADDTWTRDHGPLTVERDGSPLLLDYVFTGWGGKFEAARDNDLTRRLHAAGAYTCPLQSRELILEGGAIDTDGEGSLLTTEPACSTTIAMPTSRDGTSKHAWPRISVSSGYSGCAMATWKATTPTATWTPWHASATPPPSPTCAATIPTTPTTPSSRHGDRAARLAPCRRLALPPDRATLAKPLLRSRGRPPPACHLRQLPDHQRRGPGSDLRRCRRYARPGHARRGVSGPRHRAHRRLHDDPPTWQSALSDHATATRHPRPPPRRRCS